MKNWEDGNLDHSISKLYICLKPVLCNILDAKRGNDLGHKIPNHKSGRYYFEDARTNNE